MHVRKNTLTELTNNSWLQIDEHSPGHVFSGPGLVEEGVVGVVLIVVIAFDRHLSVGLDAVLKAVELPTGVSHLDAGLADVHADTFALQNRIISFSS